MTRPDLDELEPLAQFAAARLKGEECFFKYIASPDDVRCGGGFWVSDAGSIICENHMAYIYEKEEMSDEAKKHWRVLAVHHGRP